MAGCGPNWTQIDARRDDDNRIHYRNLLKSTNENHNL
jgi:hypothetical protein